MGGVACLLLGFNQSEDSWQKPSTIALIAVSGPILAAGTSFSPIPLAVLLVLRMIYRYRQRILHEETSYHPSTSFPDQDDALHLALCVLARICFLCGCVLWVPSICSAGHFWGLTWVFGTLRSSIVLPSPRCISPHVRNSPDPLFLRRQYPCRRQWTSHLEDWEVQANDVVRVYHYDSGNWVDDQLGREFEPVCVASFPRLVVSFEVC